MLLRALQNVRVKCRVHLQLDTLTCINSAQQLGLPTGRKSLYMLLGIPSAWRVNSPSSNGIVAAVTIAGVRSEV